MNEAEEAFDNACRILSKASLCNQLEVYMDTKAVKTVAIGEDVLSMQHITKIYSNGFVANKDITFSIRKGEIHGLVGENGAGKTTLMKVLFGQERPEEGKILLNGKEVHIENPLMALDYGIGMVHQHFMLVQSLTVAENMVLGAEPRKGKALFDYQKAVDLTMEISEKYDLPIDPDKKIKDLSVGYRQRVEILKILLRGAKILLLDEPTAVLTPQETSELFAQLKRLKEDGYTIVFISHKLGEVKEICDRITVLRRGQVVGAANIEDVTEQDISRMMVGRDVLLEIDKAKAKPKAPVLRVRNLSHRDNFGTLKLDNVSFDVRSGEILGVAGVEGNGQAELCELLSGLLKIQQGEVEVDGASIRNMSIRQIREKGVSLVHEDRMVYGVMSDGSIKENLISERYYKPEYQSGGRMKLKYIKETAEELVRDFNVKCEGIESEIRSLSGGNIQKVVAAREFSAAPKLLVAAHPTRGIDVGATELIRNKLVEMRDRLDTGILLLSADLNEVLTVSDSIIVLYDGHIAAYFPDASQVNDEMLGEYMLGIKRMTPGEIGGVIHV